MKCYAKPDLLKCDVLLRSRSGYTIIECGTPRVIISVERYTDARRCLYSDELGADLRKCFIPCL